MKETNEFAIKNISPEERPRGKMLLKGRLSLSDAELLAILLRTGTKKMSALQLAQKILADVSNDLAQLSLMSINKLTTYPGIGETKAVTLSAALELGRRRRESVVKNKKSIRSSHDVYEYMQTVLGDIPHEEFWIIMLNSTSKIINRVQIASGGFTITTVDPKKIFKAALEHNAVQLILCHNHPSGNTKPSQQDIKLTEKLKDAASLLDISVVDHVITGSENYFSFADEHIVF